MKTFCLTVLALMLTSVASAAEPTTVDADFQKRVQLDPLRLMAVQNAQTIKTFDSYARQLLVEVTGHPSFQGQDPVYTVMDLACRPGAWGSVNLIKITSVPLRKEFRTLATLSDEEKERIVKDGTVSLDLLHRPEVGAMLGEAQAADVRKARAVQQLGGAQQLLEVMQGREEAGDVDLFLPVTIVPPAVAGETNWHRAIELAGNDPESLRLVAAAGRPAPKPLPGYTEAVAHDVVQSAIALRQAWARHEVAQVNTAVAALANAVVNVDPAAYPTVAKRQVEVTYNRLARMTLPGAACYFASLVCFVLGARTGGLSLRLWGLRLMTLGLAIHTLGIGVRWWLVGSIPIKNEFESIMFAAWFGVVIGLALELGLIQAIVRGTLALVSGTKSVAGTPVRNVFGAASGFVGCLALVALFTVPYVFGTSIGQEVGQSAGVLMSYWLYIHVTMVTASYALIGMGFLLSVWWLVRYYSDRDVVGRVSPRMLEGEARGFDVVVPGGSGGGAAAAAVSFPMTVAQMLFFPVSRPAPATVSRVKPETAAAAASVHQLATLDACNLVVLQMAFWVLGVGIALGAWWADQSWGRFWGWDPKETFAAITWIVYLVAVHVRVVTERKAWWTAVLGTAGFFVMLFNWIGVNYFLKGLHSYAG